jgi:linoleoyl-CoA desaturase
MHIHFENEPAGGFYSTVRQRGEAYLSRQNSRGRFFLYTKAALIAASFLLCYYQVLWGALLWLWYALLGFVTVPLILNVGHEAAHNAFSPYRRLNRWLANVFNLVGASGLIWKERHVHSHHIYPNIYGADSDIAQNRLARIAPSAEYLPAHRYQHWYMPGLYLVYTLNWLLYRDFKDARHYFEQRPDRWQQWAILLITKAFYFFYALALPILLRPEAWTTVLAGFVLMQFVLSATTFLVLVSAHVGEDAVFPEPDATGHLPHTWAAHQLITTTDFAPDSWWVTHLFGGFNHHVVHHLFPQVSHVHYPALTQIVRTTAIEFGLPYQCFDNLTKAIFSHFHFLKKNALRPSLDAHEM